MQYRENSLLRMFRPFSPVQEATKIPILIPRLSCDVMVCSQCVNMRFTELFSRHIGIACWNLDFRIYLCTYPSAPLYIEQFRSLRTVDDSHRIPLILFFSLIIPDGDAEVHFCCWLQKRQEKILGNLHRSGGFKPKCAVSAACELSRKPIMGGFYITEFVQGDRWK